MGLKDIGLSGLTIKSMKKHPAIVPIYGLMALGMGLSGFYLWRLASKSTEVTWSRVKNPEPWNEYTNKQYKFISIGEHPSTSPAPKY